MIFRPLIVSLILSTFFFSLPVVLTITDISATVVLWKHAGVCTNHGSTWCERAYYCSPIFYTTKAGQGLLIGAAYTVYAVDVVTGTEVWQATSPDGLNARVHSSPVLLVPAQSATSVQGYEALVLTAHQKGYVCAFDVLTGAQAWCRLIEPSTAEIMGLSAARLRPDDQEWTVAAGLGVSRSYDTLYVLNEDGSTRFSRPRNGHYGEDGKCWYQGNSNIGFFDMTGNGVLDIMQPCDLQYIVAYDAEGVSIPVDRAFWGVDGTHTHWGVAQFNRDVAVEYRGWIDLGDDYQTNFCESPVTAFKVSLDPNHPDNVTSVIAVTAHYHDWEDNPGVYVRRTLFLVHPDHRRFVDQTNGFDWTLSPDDLPILSMDWNVIDIALPNVAVVDIEDSGFPVLIYPNDDGYVHARWMDKTEKHSWPFKVTTPSMIRFASEIVAFRLAEVSETGGILDRTIIAFSTHGEKNGQSDGYLHFLNGRGEQVHLMNVPDAKNPRPYNGALGAPTLFYYEDLTDNLLLSMQTVYSGNVLVEISNSNGSEILWQTARGNFQRDGQVPLFSGSSQDEIIDHKPPGTIIVAIVAGIVGSLLLVLLVIVGVVVGGVVCCSCLRRSLEKGSTDTRYQKMADLEEASVAGENGQRGKNVRPWVSERQTDSRWG